jgi:hypothetical protein
MWQLKPPPRTAVPLTWPSGKLPTLREQKPKDV